MNIGETLSFFQLFDKGFDIEIPIIQRDYAQGRESVFEVRSQFLNDIFNKLSESPDSFTQSLDLDFIYGSLNGRNPEKFSPLDGQQRLTTLFLLHWYLACKDGKNDEFYSLIGQGDKSRFTYQTRTSSAEFFNALVNSMVHIPLELIKLLPSDKDKNNSLSKTIADCQWFFLSWYQDPTIKSALVMLDAIHAKFSGSNGFYDKLIQGEKPYITFQFLNLSDFGLSDDLYIKMNARGKSLTYFESFKAKFEQLISDTSYGEIVHNRLGKVSVKDYFSNRVDNEWSDLFWHYRDDKTNLFDEQIMSFIRVLATVFYPHNKEDKNKVYASLSELRDNNIEFTFFKYNELECFNHDFVKALITILDALCNGDKEINRFLKDTIYYDEELIFKTIIGNINVLNSATKKTLNYEESVQFYAYCAYIVKFGSDININAFYEWMRVISNLSVNTIYNRVNEFNDSLAAVNTLVNDSNRILDALSDCDNAIKGFAPQQIKEEQIKAGLILKSETWKTRILEAEQHKYFKGQIEFLLKFSGILDYYNENKNCTWSDEVDREFFEKFNFYFERAKTIFNYSTEKLTLPDNFLWERALLAIGDYLIRIGSNLSFLDATNDRDTSWKRLLRGTFNSDLDVENKRMLIKQVLNKLDISNVETSLQSIIQSFIYNSGITDEWRKIIVEQTEILKYCDKHRIRKYSDDWIYLLKRERMSGSHVELYTYHLMLNYLTQIPLAPFVDIKYREVSSESEKPYVYLDGWVFNDTPNVLKIFYIDGKFRLELGCQNGEFPVQLKDVFKNKFSFVDIANNDWIAVDIDKQIIKTKLCELIKLCNDFS